MRMGLFNRQPPSFGLMKPFNAYKQLRPDKIRNLGAYQQQHCKTDTDHPILAARFEKTFSGPLPVGRRQFTTSSFIRIASYEDGEEDGDWQWDGKESERSVASKHYAGVRRIPGVHRIKLKRQGRDAGWEELRVVLILHLNKQNRKRRVWFTFDGPQPTEAELKLAWPHEGKIISRRKLIDNQEDFSRPDDDMDEPGEFIVSEKTSSEGRKFWREIIKRGELNDEEAEKEWNEWMEEEGHFREIERLM